MRNWKQANAAMILIEHGAEVDIHSACGLGMTDRIEQILAEEPNAFEKQVDSYFPIQFAISASQPDSIDCLMRAGDDPNKDLSKVAYFGWEDAALDLDYQPWKPIHMASLWGFDESRVPIIDSLRSHGADLNATSPLDGYRPIHLAAMPNRIAAIRFFVEQGVDVNSRTESYNALKLSTEDAGSVNGFDCTALMVACGEGFLEATKCLVELGADVNAQNENGHSPLHFARQKHWNGQPYDAIIELLVSNGATP
jgi:ankyrin repeat protein